jgi:hypothetical protein
LEEVMENKLQDFQAADTNQDDVLSQEEVLHFNPKP